jgi:outer membrane receptor protein involved in Fe transport
MKLLPSVVIGAHLGCCALFIESALAAEGIQSDKGLSPNEQAVNAATSVQKLEEILVTGTYIRGAENRTSSLIVLDREAIDRTGYSTTQELFRSVPQMFSGGAFGARDDGLFGIGPNRGLNFSGANGLNLRGLGESSTLVLLNGRRMAPAVFGSVVDVSLIPLAAIDRVEILADGSSALYGSDAVAGVVNIITKADYDGANTSLRYGTAIDSDRTERLLAQTVGARWEGGNVVGTAHYQHHGLLKSLDREFTSGLTQPNDVLPETESFGLALNARQRISEGLQLFGDALFSTRTVERRASAPGPEELVSVSDADSRLLNLSAGLQYAISSDWSIQFDAQFSEHVAQQDKWFTSNLFGEQLEITDVSFQERSLSLTVNGDVFQTSAGDVRAAFGASYLDQDLNQDIVQRTGAPNDQTFGRQIKAVFGELYVPLIGDGANVPLLHSLGLSAAVRYDDYSDFGSTTNPRVGVHWSPSPQISFRATYGESFRAPNPVEATLTDAFLIVYPAVAPNGVGITPALVQTGGRGSLDPETARITTLGLEYEPEFARGLSLSATYYSIRYQDRIVTPTFDPSALTSLDVYGSLITFLSSDDEAQQFIDAAIAAGQQYVDFLGSGPAGVRHVIDFRQQNALVVKQEGFDVAAAFKKHLGPGTFFSTISAASIRKIETAFEGGSVATDLVGTVGNPVKWRGRVNVGWDSPRWGISIAANYVDDYVNNVVLGDPKIASWTTCDVVARLNIAAMTSARAADGLWLTVSAQNLLDEPPPFVEAPALINVNYDATNANPLRRVIAVELNKRW